MKILTKLYSVRREAFWFWIYFPEFGGLMPVCISCRKLKVYVQFREGDAGDVSGLRRPALFSSSNNLCEVF